MQQLRIRKRTASLIVMGLPILAASVYMFWMFGHRWQHLPPLGKASLAAVLVSGVFGLLVAWRKTFVFSEKSVRIRTLLGWKSVNLPLRIAIACSGEKNEFVTVVDGDSNEPVVSLPRGMEPRLLERLREFFAKWYQTVQLDFRLELTPGLPADEITRELLRAAPWLEETRHAFTFESPDNVFRIDGDGEFTRISVTATESNVDWRSQVSLVNHLVSEFSDAGFEVNVDATYSDLLAV
jgi:hypothetical protein